MFLRLSSVCVCSGHSGSIEAAFWWWWRGSGFRKTTLPKPFSSAFGLRVHGTHGSEGKHDTGDCARAWYNILNRRSARYNSSESFADLLLLERFGVFFFFVVAVLLFLRFFFSALTSAAVYFLLSHST